MLKNKLHSIFNTFIFFLSKYKKPSRIDKSKYKDLLSRSITNPSSVRHKFHTIDTTSPNDEIAQCTFTPKINRNFKPYYKKAERPISPQHLARLYTSKSPLHIATQFQTTKDNSFDNYNTTSKSFNNNRIKTNNQRYNFYANQEGHLERVRDKILNMKIKQISNLEQECTFQPKVNKVTSKSVDIAPRYILLNNDAKVRRSNLIQLRQKIEREEEEKSPRYPRNNFNCSGIQSERYYDKLYKDAVEIRNKKNESMNRIYSDLTFMPSVNNNPKYKVKANFYERRNKSIEDRKKHLEKKKAEEKEEEEKIKKSKASKEKREEAKQHIIERLYKKEIEKINEKKAAEKKEEQKRKKKNNNIMRVVYKRKDEQKTLPAKENNTIENIDLKDSNISSELLIDKLKIDHQITFKRNNIAQLTPNASQSKDISSNSNNITPTKNLIQIKSLSDFSPLVDSSHNNLSKDETEKQNVFQSQSLNHLLSANPPPNSH